MNGDILIERLKSLGFKEYESKVMIVLLNGNPMSASDIAKEAKIIRNSIYDILKSFVDKGYCNEIETNTILNYQIIDPAIILDKLSRDYKQTFNTRMENLAETFGELQSIYKSEAGKVEGPDKNIQLIRGFNKHRVAKFIELVSNSKKEILAMYGPVRALNETATDDAKKFIKGGGVLKSIYQLSPDKQANDDFIKIGEQFVKAGEEIRLADFRIPNTFIFDNEIVLINLSVGKNIPKHKQADIIINNADFAAHIKDLFNSYWDKSLTLEQYKNNN